MKTIKQLLMTVAVLLCSATVHAYDFEVDGIYYNIISITDLTVEVTNGDNKYSGEIIIPSAITYKSKSLRVTEIGYEAFENCYNLTSIEIPNSVTKIAPSAFGNCTGLTSIEIPDSVTKIEVYAFDGCTGLTSVVIGNSVTNIEQSAFQSCTSLKNISIGNSVISIGAGAFRRCSSLTNIEIPNSVKSIGESAFWGCFNLRKLIIEDGESTLTVSFNYYPNGGIKAALFNDCNNVETVYLGRNLDYNFDTPPPFENRKSLKSLVIGKHVKRLSNAWDGHFCGCSGLTTIYLLGTNPPNGDDNFTNSHYINATVYVPQGSLSTYQSSDVWGNFWNIKYLVKTQPTAENLQIELDCSEEGIEYQWYESVGEYTYTKEIIPTSNGDYAWTDSAGIWTSGNWGKSQTKSIMNATIDFQIGDTISFDYTVPKGDGYSYSGSQWFSFLFNGKTVMQTFGGSGNSSHYELGINEYIYTKWMKGNSTVTIGFECVRNGDGNSEHATVSDIKLIRPTGFPMGEWVDEKIAGATTAMLDENMFVKGGVAYCVVNLPNGITLMSDKVRVPSYTLTYMIDGEVYYKDTLRYKAKIVQPEVPIKEGYTFSGWSEAPTIMPANDIIVEGSYIAETAIEHVLLYPEKNEVYNAQGVRITDTSNLVRGIYIINGKKIFVK